MGDSAKVWVSTAAIDSILHPKDSSAGKRLGRSPGAGGSSDDPDSQTVNWGWTSATVLSGGHSGDDALDGKSDVRISVEDEESEFHRVEVDIPGKCVGEGAVMMQNCHGDDGDSMGYDGRSGPRTSFDGDEACGYPDDLTTLTHLHEPAVVQCLRKRYERGEIYTNTGPILIALNPFKSCRSLYGDRVMRRYWERGEAMMLMGGGGEEEALPPHVYDLADAAYRSMLLEIDVGGGRRGRDQSILVSGESGAGKTVTTKFIMQYLATLSGHRADAENGKEGKKPPSTKKEKGPSGKQLRSSLQRENSRLDASVEQQVLQSNPVLESFGNARTVRNDNSSRFGKFIEMRFDSEGTLVGASIETYLLEKVRLISQSEGERNYHIFYEMLSGMTDEDRGRFLLGDYSAKDFKITSGSGTYDRRDGVKDADTYELLVDALEVMGFEPEQLDDVFNIASAVMHLSNLTVNPIKGGEECEIDASSAHLEPILQLLGVTKDSLNQALCYFEIEARGQSYTRAVQKDKAEKGLEALIKATYSAMFDFIVRRINSSITVKKKTAGDAGKGVPQRAAGGGPSSAAIGVLDIFGFESFRTNSLEQLCINYCNEALQQQFNLSVLKNEQEEYEREGIGWNFISFTDNQDALDLIWKKGCGILNILDDQCRAPGTTDKTFANDIYQKLSKKPRFEANFRQVGARRFGILHFAGLVEYDTDGFVEKNRDELPRKATDLLLLSSSDFVKELASIISSISAPEPAENPRVTAGGKRKSRTVGGHFASQLQSLRAKIGLTSPHYVRCLKPNSQLVPDSFDPLMIVEQLRCAGVVETVRVSRMGYPQRYNHSQFVNRYRVLGPKETKKAARLGGKVKPVVALVDAIARKTFDATHKSPSSPARKGKKQSSSGDKIELSAIGIQVGKTKVFLQRKAFDTLEKMRKDFLITAAINVQAIVRGYIAYRTYNESRYSSLSLQCWARVIIATRRMQKARERANARRIQSEFRRHRARMTFLAALVIARWCQRRRRGIIGRARYRHLSKLLSAEEMLVAYAGREDQLCKNLKKMKSKQDNEALIRSLVTQMGINKSADELLQKYEGREEVLLKSLSKMKSKRDNDASIRSLVAEMGIKKSADEMLKKYEGREEVLLRNLSKMEAEKRKDAKIIAEIKSMIEEDDDAKSSADKLLVHYRGREERLHKNLSQMRLMKEKDAQKMAEIKSLIAKIHVSKSSAEELLVHYRGREERLLKNLRKMSLKREKDAAAMKREKEDATAAKIKSPMTENRKHLKEMSIKQEKDVETTKPEKDTETMAEVKWLVAENSVMEISKYMLEKYGGREELLLKNLHKMKCKTTSKIKFLMAENNVLENSKDSLENHKGGEELSPKNLRKMQSRNKYTASSTLPSSPEMKGGPSSSQVNEKGQKELAKEVNGRKGKSHNKLIKEKKIGRQCSMEQ